MQRTNRARPAWVAGWRRRLALLCLALLFGATAQAVERRRDQFPTEEAYLFVPFPYSIPGIGSGIAYSVLAANFVDEHMDVYGLFITGDAGGTVVGAEDMHLIHETLILSVNTQNITRATVNNYESRGMNNSGDDFTLLEVDKADGYFAELRLSLQNRQYEAFLGTEHFESSLVRVRDSDGNLISEFATPLTEAQTRTIVGLRLDLTDDWGDPRRGIRAEVTASHSPPDGADAPDYYVWNYSLSGYVPIGKISTLVLNYFRSDADVHRQGNTDPAAILADIGLECDAAAAACLAVQDQLLQQTIASRANGTAASLGGERRLRAFPGDRFKGAHTEFVGLEFRWNVTEEATPFNYFIWKDVRTNVQFAFFYEIGSVAETRADLGSITRSSYGAGVRMVSGSGFVYRADLATGEEGGEVTILFNYPY